MTPQLTAVVSQAFQCIGGSKLCEDGFRELRNEEALKSGWCKKMSDNRKMKALVSSGLTSAVHRFKDVVWETASEPRMTGASFAAFFRPSLRSSPPWLRDVVGTKAKCGWHSPSPLREVQAVHDLFAIRHYFGTGGFRQAGDTWCSLLFGGRRDSEVQHCFGPAPDDSNHVALGGSLVLVWRNLCCVALEPMSRF